MRISSMVVAALMSTSLVACGGAGSAESEGSSGATEEELAARAPIPFVLQYVGEYDGDGSGDFDWVVLRRNGTFAASIDGRVERGSYVGPKAPASPLKVVFVAHGDTFSAIVADDYAQRPPRSTLAITHYGRSEKVTSAFAASDENMCDSSGGSWTDDDADPKTGLFCVCPGRKVYIPSLGGCVK
jgi:hypothetical protein